MSCNYDAISLATPQAFSQDHSLVWQFYHYRREKALMAQPNAAHDALALFSIPTIRNTLTHPDGSTFHHITQNIDGLSMRSLATVYAAQNLPIPTATTTDSNGRPILLEMHGRLFDLLCTKKQCRHVDFDTSSPVCPALAGTENIMAGPDIQDVDSPTVPEGPHIADADLPRCSKCGSLARPGVVWFGETPKYLNTIDEIINEADLCLVIGTSSVVYPAASYAYNVHQNGGKVAVFNLEPTPGNEYADFVFMGPCEETLVEALELGPQLQDIQN